MPEPPSSHAALLYDPLWSCSVHCGNFPLNRSFIDKKTMRSHVVAFGTGARLPSGSWTAIPFLTHSMMAHGATSLLTRRVCQSQGPGLPCSNVYESLGHVAYIPVPSIVSNPLRMRAMSDCSLTVRHTNCGRLPPPHPQPITFQPLPSLAICHLLPITVTVPLNMTSIHSMLPLALVASTLGAPVARLLLDSRAPVTLLGDSVGVLTASPRLFTVAPHTAVSRDIAQVLDWFPDFSELDAPKFSEETQKRIDEATKYTQTDKGTKSEYDVTMPDGTRLWGTTSPDGTRTWGSIRGTKSTAVTGLKRDAEEPAAEKTEADTDVATPAPGEPAPSDAESDVQSTAEVTASQADHADSKEEAIGADTSEVEAEAAQVELGADATVEAPQTEDPVVKEDASEA